MVKLSVEESLGDELVSSRFIERFRVSRFQIYLTLMSTSTEISTGPVSFSDDFY